MNKPSIITALLIGSIAVGASAASLTEIKANGHLAKLYVDGSKGRMETGDAGYILVDSRKHKLYMVVPKQGQAVDMSSYLKKAAARPGAKTSFKPAGNGPTIAGYTTKRYDFKVGGQPCGSVYASKKALSDSGAKVLVQAMERIAAQARERMGDGGGTCGRGRDNVVKVIASIGMPMRITNKQGGVDSEVVKIAGNASLPAGAFDLPAGIKVRDGAQIESMLKQAQESLSPDMMDKLREARKKYMR